MEDAAPPRPARGAALSEIGREDLDLYAVQELQQRIAALEAETARTRHAMQRKMAGRSAADALFSFGKADDR